MVKPKSWESTVNPKELKAHACHCVGPQNGEPLCPCMMRGVTKKDGRWIIPEKDLGPVIGRN
jgi:hypothetical protein